MSDVKKIMKLLKICVENDEQNGYVNSINWEKLKKAYQEMMRQKRVQKIKGRMNGVGKFWQAIKCRLGLHKWKTTVDEIWPAGNYQERKCQACRKFKNRLQKTNGE